MAGACPQRHAQEQARATGRRPRHSTIHGHSCECAALHAAPNRRAQPIGPGWQIDRCHITARAAMACLAWGGPCDAARDAMPLLHAHWNGDRYGHWRSGQASSACTTPRARLPATGLLQSRRPGLQEADTACRPSGEEMARMRMGMRHSTAVAIQQLIANGIRRIHKIHPCTIFIHAAVPITEIYPKVLQNYNT